MGGIEICFGFLIVVGILTRYFVGPFSTLEERALTNYWSANPQYVKTLHQIARRSIYRDEFGDMERGEWEKALRSFIAKKASELSGGKRPKDLSEKYVQAVETALRVAWESQGLLDPGQAQPIQSNGTDETEEHGQQRMSAAAAVEFEQRCADVLLSCGWETQHTGRAGDQGADLIARKNGVTTVVQCKNYSGSVSNAAVQQAAAAKGFYDAHKAIVVTDYGRFTRSARQLAQKLDVALVTFSSLTDHLQKGR